MWGFLTLLPKGCSFLHQVQPSDLLCNAMKRVDSPAVIARKSYVDPYFEVEIFRKIAANSAKETGGDSWYMVNLFMRSEPQELIRICQKLLSSFLYLDHDFFGRGWPLVSRLRLPSLQSRSPSPPALASAIPSSPRCLFVPAHNCSGSSPNVHHPPNELLSAQQVTPKMKKSESTPNLHPSSPKSPNAVIKLIKRAKEILHSPMARPVSPSVFVSPFHEADSISDAESTKSSPNEKHYEAFGIMIGLLTVEYVLEDSVFQDVVQQEGLFRKPGNLKKVKDVYAKMVSRLVESGGRIRTHASVSSGFRGSPSADHHPSIFEDLLCDLRPYDLASLIQHAIAQYTRSAPKGSKGALTDGTGLIPAKAVELLIKITNLQYELEGDGEVDNFSAERSWVRCLCHSRQLLGYRIVIHLLLPHQERHFLLRYLCLLHRIHLQHEVNKMSAQNLAICVAGKLFGRTAAERNVPGAIDTLTNLIEMFDEVQALPHLVCQRVRRFVEARMGASPRVQRSPLQQTTHDLPRSPVYANFLDATALKRTWSRFQESDQNVPNPLSALTPRSLPKIRTGRCRLQGPLKPLKLRNWGEGIEGRAPQFSPLTPQLLPPKPSIDQIGVLEKRVRAAHSPVVGPHDLWKVKRAQLSAEAESLGLTKKAKAYSLTLRTDVDSNAADPKRKRKQ